MPHGKVIPATYKNFAAKEKRMHVYLPPDYDTDTNARYLVLYLSRALAGLSMGGFVVMNTGLAHFEIFGELYVYISGYFPDQLADAATATTKWAFNQIKPYN